MHLSHYDIVCSILSKSKIGKEMYIYDNADIILSEFMFSRWDATFKNQTEYNRLKNGGITQVMNKDLRKHGTVGYQNNRRVTITRNPLIQEFIRTAQNLTFLEQNPLIDEEMEKNRQSEMRSRRMKLT